MKDFKDTEGKNHKKSENFQGFYGAQIAWAGEISEKKWGKENFLKIAE